MADLTDKKQPFVGAIGITGMPTHRAGFARIVGVHLDRHTAMAQGLVGDHGAQLGKGPLALTSVGFPLLLARLFAMLALRALADVCQLFQSNQTVRVSGHDPFGDHMIGILLQPSLSPANGNETPCCGTSAFSLKTLSESGVVIGFGNNGLA